MAVLNFDIKSVALPSGQEAKAVLLTGSIDASTNQQFESRLTDILNSGTHHVLLVLSNVKYINSTGLGTIVKCVDAFREHHGDIKLVGVPTKVIALFEMLGLLALFETHDTVEAAVASFGKAAVADAATAAPAVKFPLQIKHPVTGMGLNVSQPGRFKDPRSGDYFSVASDGTVQFYAVAKVKLAEIKVPCDVEFAPAVAHLAKALATKAGLPASVAAAAEHAVDEIAAVMRSASSDASESCNVLLVADHEKLSIGFVSHGNALNLPADAPVLKVLAGLMSEVKHQVLPTRGFLLSATKTA